jgi:hypothetical protein
MTKLPTIDFNDYFLKYLKNNTASLLVSEIINTQILTCINQTSSATVKGLSSNLLRMIHSHFENEDFIENFQLTKLPDHDVWYFSCFAASPYSSIEIKWELHLINGVIEFNDSFDPLDICEFHNKIVTIDKIDLKKIKNNIHINVISEANGGFAITTTLLNKELSNYAVSNHINLKYAN